MVPLPPAAFDTSLSVIMPAYNEEENIRRNLPPLIETLDGLVRDFEIIVVDDGSTDSTVETVRATAADDPRIRLVQHETNMGPGSGVVTGIPLAACDLVVFLPADIALRLDQLDRFLAAAQNADIVVGVSSARSDYTALRRLASAVYIAMIKLLFGLQQRQFNYIHMYRREAVQACAPQVKGVFISVEILVKARDAGRSFAEVDVDYVPRRHGSASCGKPAVILKPIGDAVTFWRSWRFGRRRRLSCET